MLGGGESDTIVFKAPKSGEYDFLCSFPGHYSIMNGKFIVEDANGNVAVKQEKSQEGGFSFFNTSKTIHNLNGMVILFTLLLVIITLAIRFLLKKPFNKTSKLIALVGLIIAHLQLLIGVILYFISPLGISHFSGESMKNSISRFYIVEHPVGMILAVVLITIAYSSSKKTSFTDKKKYSRILLFYTLALLIIAYLVPWFLWN